MKVLLDECLPADFRHLLIGHEVHTVQWAGFKGQTNGELLRAAESSGYDVFVTVDRRLPQSTAVQGNRIAIVLIRTRSNRLQDVAVLAPAVLAALETITPGTTVVAG